MLMTLDPRAEMWKEHAVMDTDSVRSFTDEQVLKEFGKCHWRDQGKSHSAWEIYRQRFTGQPTSVSVFSRATSHSTNSFGTANENGMPTKATWLPTFVFVATIAA
jgi:hypothetical protein